MNKIIKGEITFVRILIPFVAGIVYAYCYPPSAKSFSYGLTAAITLLLTFGFIVINYKRVYRYHLRWIIGVAITLFLFLSAFLLTAQKSGNLETLNFSKHKYTALVTTVRTEPRTLTGGILRFEADITQGLRGNKFYPAAGRLMISVREPSEEHTYGDRLLIPATYNEVPAPLNPGEFDYKQYLSDHHVHYQSFLNGGQVKFLHLDQEWSITSFALALRKQLVSKFSRYIEDKDAASVASTLILGYRSDLSKDVVEAYLNTGTMHVLSVSGMHVGIVFMVMVFLLRFMERTKLLRLIRAMLMITLIWFYAVITGFSPSVCRSAMMISFIIIGKALQRSQNTYNLLAISAVLLLIYDPLFIFDVGFQLSYLSVAGLVYLYPKIYKLLYFKYWLSDQLWSAISVSTAAQLATFPLSLYYFHQFPMYFLVSNIFILVPVAFVMYSGLLFLFVPWEILLKPLGWMLCKSIILTNRVLFYIEHLPFATIDGIWINTATYLLLYSLLLMLVFAFLYQRKWMVYSCLLIVLSLLMASSVNNIERQSDQKVIFYSLRKNKAIGFFDRGGANIITDLNENDKAFSYSILPLLSSGSIYGKKLIKPGTAFSTDRLFYDGNFIQFGNRTFLVWDKTFNKTSFAKQTAVDLVLLQDNPQVTIRTLMRYVRFKMLLIDGSNSAYHIKKWESEASTHRLKYYTLKGNKAYIIKVSG